MLSLLLHIYILYCVKRPHNAPTWVVAIEKTIIIIIIIIIRRGIGL